MDDNPHVFDVLTLHAKANGSTYRELPRPKHRSRRTRQGGGLSPSYSGQVVHVPSGNDSEFSTSLSPTGSRDVSCEPTSFHKADILGVIHAEVDAKMLDYKKEIFRLKARVSELERRCIYDVETKLNTAGRVYEYKKMEPVAPTRSDGYALVENPMPRREFRSIPCDDLTPGGGQECSDNAGFAESLSPRALDDELPKSVFCYCLTMLPQKDRFWTSTTFFVLMLDLCLQQVLLMALLDSAILLSLTDHWGSSGATSEENKFDCTFSDADTHGWVTQIKYRLALGKPVIEFLVGCSAIYVTASSIALDDRENLSAVRHLVSGRMSVNVTLNIAWWIAVVYQPAVFAVGAANIFANSTNSLEIVMNAVAVSFILDIDDVMYELLLNSSEKEEYQSNVSKERYPPRTVYQFTWAFFMVSGLVMVICFVRLHSKHDESGEDYYNMFFGALGVDSLLIIATGGRSALHYLAHLAAGISNVSPQEEASVCSKLCKGGPLFFTAIFVAVGSGICAKAMQTFMHIFFAPAFHNTELLDRCFSEQPSNLTVS